MLNLFDPLAGGQPDRELLRKTVAALQDEYSGRGTELKQVASGYRFQVNHEFADWVNRLSEDRPPRYSRALLETIAIIAYRQPVSRGDIEDIRGVAVSSHIMRTLIDRDWVRVAGHRDVPGRPAVYTTTRQFLDYFNLKSISEMPNLSELRDIDDINPDLFADQPGEVGDPGPGINMQPTSVQSTEEEDSSGQDNWREPADDESLPTGEVL